MSRKRRAVETLVSSGLSSKRQTLRSAKSKTIVQTATDSVVFEIGTTTTRRTKTTKTAKAIETVKKDKKAKAAKTVKTVKAPLADDKEFSVDNDDAGDTDASEAESPPAPVNSTYLPLPWKGRLGYACLNTYLRSANPPVFCSRTCRIASVLENRHPLRDPASPAHPTKNRPDKTQPASVERGLAYVQRLGLANARDVVRLLRWNERYGIRFLRLSSEMFPLASHAEYGYALAPFAADALAAAGRVAASLGHRLTTHPGQYTQLGSPRPEVIDAAVRDLAYHDELLTLLRLPPQQDRDAVMILHMGGVFGDKAATLARFRHVYTTRLSASVRRRLVLENDDVAWSVHDLLPVCEALDIPLVLDFHHHNIVWDHDSPVRPGTADVAAETPLAQRIRATWTRKGITQKMHYSEPAVPGGSARERRKHSARVATLPPCRPDMDLMIEAKDKEQAVLALMRKFELPGWELAADMVPHERDDEEFEDNEEENKGGKNAEEFGMGGPHGRVFWPEGNEAWLKRKRSNKGGG